MRVRELRPGSSANSATKLPPDSDSRAAPLPFFRPHNRTWITRPDFRLFPLFCALFFPLLPIVPAPAAFLSSFQRLALYLARIFHCRSVDRLYFGWACLGLCRTADGPPSATGT